MRRLGTLAPPAAQRFAAALRSRGIGTDLRPEPDGSSSIWVNDEDQLPAAREVLTAFEADPNARRFDPPPASETDIGHPKSEQPAGARRGESAWRRAPVTLMLIGTSVIVSLVTLTGDFWPGRGDFGSRAAQDLYISSHKPVLINGRPGIQWDDLNEIKSGQIWRLVTPIFMHGGPLHLLFNMAWLWLLGGAVEAVRGSWRLAALVLISAVASNLAEYYFNFGFDIKGGITSDIGFHPDPMFLGMSGVVFALFGFVWIRSRLVPRSGFLMPRDMVVWMLIWLLVCTSGLAGPIANVAHGVGLLVGMVLGGVPRLWRKA